MTANDYLTRLARRSEQVGSMLCLGVDPDPAALPAGFPAGVAGIERLATLLVEHAAPRAAAVKANVAFYEAYGSQGIAVLERIRRRLPPDLLFIADAKRGDIGSTAARQAVALLDELGADAVTLNPYLGVDAIEPFLERADRFAYVLCRTSNPSAGELQDLAVDGEPLYVRVARRVAEWAASRPRLGLVVGATAPDELAAVRLATPSLVFLVPGVGVQGGDLAAVQAHGPARAGPAAGRPGGGLLVNVSRGIAAAALAGADPAHSIEQAATDWSARLNATMGADHQRGG